MLMATCKLTRRKLQTSRNVILERHHLSNVNVLLN